MKKWALLGIVGVALQAGALPLSQEARQEANLFNTFLEAAYAQRHADPARFALLQKALAKEPDSWYLKQQLVAEALAANVPSLADPYADFIDTAGDDADAWSVYGAYQWTKENVPEALRAYEKALELEPEDERILFQYVTILAATDPQKAETELKELARTRPNYAPEIYTEIGRMYLYHRNYSAALKAFDKAVSLDKENPQPRIGRATVFEKTSQYFLMLHELEELEKMGYVTAQMYAQMGSVYVLVKDFPHAEDYFLKAKELDNGNIAAGYFLSVLAEQQGDYPRVISYLKDTADYNESPTKQIQVSYFQRKLNQNEESFKTISQAYKKFKDNNEVDYLYAVALYERGKYRQSAQVLLPLVEKLPDNQDVRLQYTYALEGQKKYKEMEKQVSIILEQNPQNAAALNLQAYSWALRKIRLDEAAEYSARALAIVPQDVSFIDTQAYIFYLQGNYMGAADLIKSIPHDVFVANPEMAYHAGIIYVAAGQTEQGRFYLQLAADGGWKDAQKALKKMK